MNRYCTVIQLHSVPYPRGAETLIVEQRHDNKDLDSGPTSMCSLRYLNPIPMPGLMVVDVRGPYCKVPANY